jgi:hypothetical protein
MVDMPVIVRHQDRGALRLDHLHNRHYANRRRIDLIFDHRHNAEKSAMFRVSWPAAGTARIARIKV